VTAVTVVAAPLASVVDLDEGADVVPEPEDDREGDVEAIRVLEDVDEGELELEGLEELVEDEEPEVELLKKYPEGTGVVLFEV
jgi:hypothetical protein